MNIVFINMPFSAIRPAIGVSLLKAHLSRVGISSQILYLNMRFARRFGVGDYEYIAERTPSQALAGDWVFSRAAFGTREEADVGYLACFGQRFGRFPTTRHGLDILVRARDIAEGFIEESLSNVDWSSFDVIGFTSTFTQNVASLALAKRIKAQHPAAVIVFGGANCEAEMGVALHRCYPCIDYVCSGEADESFISLIRSLQTGRGAEDIPGVISRVGGRTHFQTLQPKRIKDLDALPYPDYGDYFEQYAREFPRAKSRSPVLMESSRGCWWGEKHHCTFCGLNGTSMTFRSKSAGRVLDEITALCERYESPFVEMVDNILDMRYFDSLLPELERRKLRVGLFYETKANLTKKQVHALFAAGVCAIQPGIESLSTDVLRLMRKGTTAIQNVQLMKWCKERGLNVLWNLIYGFPNESPAAYEAIARVMDSIHHLQPPYGFSAIRLDRFSPNFHSAATLGLCNVRPDRSYAYIYDLPGAELFDVAYYFEHDYADGRDPESYVGSAQRAMGRWRRSAESASVIAVDHVDMLAIWDLRTNASRTLTVLSDWERALYDYCDQNRSLRQLQDLAAQHGASAAEVADFIDSMNRHRLMLEIDGRYLSLAVRSESGRQAPPCTPASPRADAHVLL